MKKIYSSQDRMMVVLMKASLESGGLRWVIKNEWLAGAAGELPPIECWPELWIVDDEQYQWARSLVKAVLDAADQEPAWQCLRCGESLEGQFAQCWQCGQLRDHREAQV